MTWFRRERAEEQIDVTPREVAERLRAGEPLRLLDVREPHELDKARLESAENLPLSAMRFTPVTIDPEVATVVMCHHGHRSSFLVNALRAQGYTRVFNLAGGIDAWSREVDGSVPRY